MRFENLEPGMDRRDFLRLGSAGLAAAVLLGTAGATDLRAETGPLRARFGSAAAKYGVPEDLLLAMGYVNTRWEMPPPEASPYEPNDLHGRGAYGIMQLVRNPWRDTLGAAASLTGISREKLKTSRAANVKGGAAVLSEIQGEKKPRDLDGWYDAVAEYGDGALYAGQVFEVLESGASATTSSGEKIELAPHGDVEPRDPLSRQATGDYPGSTFYGADSGNYWTGRTYKGRTYDVNKIVVHVMQGSWSGTINWFKDPRAGASCHYSVRSSDGFVGQSVRERDTAYHAGHWTTNLTSVGIEHEGYIGEPRWFTAAMYRSSAKLAAYLCKKHRIPVDREHIIGHDQVPGCSGGSGGGVSCHTDPGRHWDWARYMDLIRGYLAESGSTYAQVVDNATSGRFRASDRWILSSYHSATNYGANHRVLRKPLSISDNAAFKIKTPAKDSYAVYGWWPADPGYNDRTVFRIRTSGGWVSKTVNQRTNGGRWVSLGTYTLDAGDSYRVQVSSRSAGRGYIVADAVRVVRR